MEASQNLAGASLHPPLEWSLLNWRKLYRNGRRLQTRIVQAIKFAASP